MLRPYQKDALAAIKKTYQDGIGQQVIVMATGLGKTVIASHLPSTMADILPGQTLFVAHRGELLQQAMDKMRLYNPGLKVDMEMAEHRADPDADVIVASVQTLGRKGTKRAERFNWDNVDKIVIDEVQHGVADSYLNLLDTVEALKPGKLLLGITATPGRADGKALAQVYKKISYTYGLRKAVEDGYLCEPHGIRVRTDTSLDKVKTVGGDFNADELSDTINTPERNLLAVKAWLEHAKGRQTIGFTASIQHALDLAEMFVRNGIKAEAVWGADPQRAEKLARYASAETAVILNCNLLTEGYDNPATACILLTSPTKSSIVYTQRVGRGTRLSNGKKDCLVIDLVDSSSRHSLVTLPTLMGLSASLDLRGKGLIKSVQAIEQAAKEHPSVDFSKLPSIDTIQTMIEEADLFNVVFPSEVEAASELSWHTAPTGGYVLMLPNKDEVRIRQNLLDRWEISGHIKGKKYKGERETLEEVFSAADKLVADTSPEVLKVVRREEKWHNDPPTGPQLKRLAQIFKGKQLPLNLTKGQASKLIGQHVAGKK